MGTEAVESPVAPLNNSQKNLPVAKNSAAKMVLDRFGPIRDALCSGIDPMQFLASCVKEINKLKEPKAEQTVNAVFNAAVLGFIPGEAYGHCYFIPYKGKVQLVIGYKGFLELAYDCNFLSDIHSDVILAGEEWKYWKSAAGPQCDHPVPLDRELTWENVRGAYCIYHTVTGGTGIVVVNRAELQKINTNENVWASQPIAMCKKTPIRRASKEWRQTRRLAMAVNLDEQAERDEYQSSDYKEPKQPAIDLSALPETDVKGLGNDD